MSTRTERTDEGSIEHGLRLEEFMGFIDWLEESPADGRLEFRASSDAEAVANRTTATIGSWALGGGEMGDGREHTLEFGLPPEL